jgi:hypothetical protein
VVALAAEPIRALVFSKTAGFRHGDSIKVGNKMLEEQFKAAGLEVDVTEDAAVFTAENLAKYRAVAFMSVTGDVMGDIVAKDATKDATTNKPTPAKPDAAKPTAPKEAPKGEPKKQEAKPEPKPVGG